MFRNFPAFVTLLAGFVSSVVMILHKYTLVEFLWILATVMVIFYLIAVLIRSILRKAFAVLEEKKQEDTQDTQESATEDSDGEPKEGENEEE